MALRAGNTPASVPKKLNIPRATMAMVKLIWGLCIIVFSPPEFDITVFPNSKTATPKAIPKNPATIVNTIDSLSIWFMICHGVAPIAR